MESFFPSSLRVSNISYQSGDIESIQACRKIIVYADKNGVLLPEIWVLSKWNLDGRFRLQATPRMVFRVGLPLNLYA